MSLISGIRSNSRYRIYVRKRSFPNPAPLVSLYVNEKVDFFHYFDNEKGYGCVAKEQIAEGELLLSVPYEECVWPDPDNEDPVIGLLSSLSRSDLYHITRVKESKVLEPILPFTGLPEKIKSVSCSITHVFESLVRPLFNTSYHRWMVALLLSRCFSGKGSSIAFVPMADQFNHSSVAANTHIRETDEGFVFFAERAISIGEEILNDYGIESDIEMYVTHGFVCDGLKNSFVYVPISLMGEEVQPDSEDVLIRIDVDSPSIVPDELIVNSDGSRVVAGLLRAMDRMIASMQSMDTIQEHELILKDLKNCIHYRNRLSQLSDR